MARCVQASQTSFTGTSKVRFNVNVRFVASFHFAHFFCFYFWYVTYLNIFERINPFLPLFLMLFHPQECRDKAARLNFAKTFFPFFSISMIPHSANIFMCCGNGRSAYIEIFSYSIKVHRIISYKIYDLPPCRIGNAWNTSRLASIVIICKRMLTQIYM